MEQFSLVFSNILIRISDLVRISVTKIQKWQNHIHLCCDNFHYINLNVMFSCELVRIRSWWEELPPAISIQCLVCLNKKKYIYIYIYIYGIHHWQILWSSYRRLAWVGVEPTAIEFCSDALTDWAIRPWDQPTLRANLVQLLQFHRLFSVTFDSAYLRSSVAAFIWTAAFCR